MMNNMIDLSGGFRRDKETRLVTAEPVVYEEYIKVGLI